MKQQIESLLRQAVDNFAAANTVSTPTFTMLIEHPRDPSHGDLASNIALVLAKPMSMPPRALAEKLIPFIPASPSIASVEIAGPGFINFRFSTQYLLDQFESLARSKTYGVLPIESKQTVVVDYSSPNLAKEMHVGHLRSTIIGDAIARILEFKGFHVIRQNHVGDWGTQFGMLLAHLEASNHQHDTQLQLQDLEKFYIDAKKQFDSDPAFADKARQIVVQLQSGDADYLKQWKLFIDTSLAHCQAIYDRLGISLHPTDVRAESAYNDALPKMVEALQQQGLLIEHEDAKCVFLPEFKGKENEPLPIIIQKRDGGFLYASTDLAAIIYRQSELHADRVLYVVDSRQALHFKQIFALAKAAHFAKETLQMEHIQFGMVLDKKGKPFKSRDGGVTKLKDLIDEAEKRATELLQQKSITVDSEEEVANMARVLAISSVKYADLSKNRVNDYMFDWDHMLSFEGNTAPYMLYANTRIHSLFRKANIKSSDLQDPLNLATEHDVTLLKKLLQFPEIIDQVGETAAPHLLCTYLYELAGTFSSFYEAAPILNQADATLRASRLRLASTTSHLLEQGLALLGINTLTRM